MFFNNCNNTSKEKQTTNCCDEAQLTREISQRTLSFVECEQVIKCASYCNIGICSNAQPYVLPAFYNITELDETPIFELANFFNQSNVTFAVNDAVVLQFMVKSKTEMFTIWAIGTITAINTAQTPQLLTVNCSSVNGVATPLKGIKN